MAEPQSKDEVRSQAAQYRARANALSLEALSLKRGEKRLLMFKRAVAFERVADALELELAA